MPQAMRQRAAAAQLEHSARLARRLAAAAATAFSGSLAHDTCAYPVQRWADGLREPFAVPRLADGPGATSSPEMPVVALLGGRQVSPEFLHAA